MNRLLAHGVAKNFSPSQRARVHRRAEQKTSGYGCGTRLFPLRCGVDRRSGLQLACVVRKRRNRMVLARVSLVLSRHFLGHCFGAYATPGGRLALLLCYAPSGLRFPPSADPP